MEIGTLFTKALAISTLAGNASIILLVVVYVLARPLYERVMLLLSRYAIHVGLFLAGASTIGSLVYSEIVGFPACILCWMSRIFMYPMMFLFGLALYRKDRGVLPYTLFLSVIGGVIAVYHWTKDMLALYSDVVIPCPAVTGLPSCDRIYVLEYGYITIPMIALNAFILIGIVAYAGMRRRP